MLAFYNLVPLLTVLSTIVAGAASLVQAFMVLSAKRRFRIQILRLSEQDYQLSRLRQLALSNHLGKDDAEQVDIILEEAAKTLSDNDRRLVERGLYQNSVAGKKRYIREMLSAA